MKTLGAKRRHLKAILLNSSEFFKNKLTSLNISELKQRMTSPSVKNLNSLFILLPVNNFYRILNLLDYMKAFAKLP